VNHIDDTAAINKVNGVITQTDATNFKTLMLAKVVIDYENHDTTEWPLQRNKNKLQFTSKPIVSAHKCEPNQEILPT